MSLLQTRVKIATALCYPKVRVKLNFFCFSIGFFFFFVNKKKIVLILHEIILFSIALFFNLQLLCDFNKGSNISLCVNTLLLVFFIHLIVKKNSSLSKVIHYYNQRPFFFNLSRFFLIRLAPFPHFEKLLCFRRNGALIL